MLRLHVGQQQQGCCKQGKNLLDILHHLLLCILGVLGQTFYLYTKCFHKLLLVFLWCSQLLVVGVIKQWDYQEDDEFGSEWFTLSLHSLCVKSLLGDVQTLLYALHNSPHSYQKNKGEFFNCFKFLQLVEISANLAESNEFLRYKLS